MLEKTDCKEARRKMSLRELKALIVKLLLPLRLFPFSHFIIANSKEGISIKDFQFDLTYLSENK
ncbi:UNVERIFIED_CONTAM: hypothetical protein NCL1_42318 [Trichonephila clavipes]